MWSENDYMHIHVIPDMNNDLLQKHYRVSEKPMEQTWRECLADQSKYTIVDPQTLMSPISSMYSELTKYLEMRYW